MTLDDLRFLLSPAGQRFLQETAETPIRPQNHLQIATRLRAQLAPNQAQAVLETLLLRQKATAKFTRAGRMFFTRPALEQASSEAVSIYRRGRFAAAGYDHIADLGCGIGGDALHLAARTMVTGVEWDPVRLAMARENVRVYEHGRRFQPLQADLLTLAPLPVDALFFDPARRDERGRRFFSVHKYRPPLSLIDRWRTVVPDAAVKISPGVDYAQIPGEAEIEFISLKGEVKEGVLWFGGLSSGVRRRATLLPEANSLTEADLPPEPIPVTEPKAYLYEPDGAVIRAHLVEALAAQLGATKIDGDIAYLTADALVTTPFARCYAIEACFPFQLKRLRHYLHAHGIGHVTIKKRGSPLEPEKLRRQLRLLRHHDTHRILFLTQLRGKAAVLIGQLQNTTPDIHVRYPVLII